MPLSLTRIKWTRFPWAGWQACSIPSPPNLQISSFGVTPTKSSIHLQYDSWHGGGDPRSFLSDPWSASLPRWLHDYGPPWVISVCTQHKHHYSSLQVFGPASSPRQVCGPLDCARSPWYCCLSPHWKIVGLQRAYYFVAYTKVVQ